jgi:ribose transport system substrate-binding protein
MNCKALFILPACICFTLALHTQSVNAQTEIVGATLQFVNTNTYIPLPNAKIQAYRGGAVFPSPMTSEGDGSFRIVVPPGGPFTLTFYLDKDRIPELQELAAISGGRHAVYVALLTVKQYRELAAQKLVPPLSDRLQCLKQELPEGSEPYRIVQEISVAVAMTTQSPAISTTSALAADQNVTIPIVVKDTSAFFWRIVLAGARKAGRDLDVKVPEFGAQSESDINSILKNAVSEKPAAIVIAPTEFAAPGKLIDEAAKKVKIIGIDSAADSTAFTSLVTTDNVQAGRLAADGLAAAITVKYGKANGEVALITSQPSERDKGFKEQIANKYPGLELVAEKVADGTTGLNIMTDLMTTKPNLRGVFASNLITTHVAGDAIADNKVADRIKLVGFDSDDTVVKLLANGTIAALVVQDPYRMGYEGVRTALAASKGEKVEPHVDSGANLITKENLNTPRSQELLNPNVQ